MELVVARVPPSILSPASSNDKAHFNSARAGRATIRHSQTIRAKAGIHDLTSPNPLRSVPL